jgi:hypothetical protein
MCGLRESKRQPGINFGGLAAFVAPFLALIAAVGRPMVVAFFLELQQERKAVAPKQ